jgi:hypothetical protein
MQMRLRWLVGRRAFGRAGPGPRPRLPNDKAREGGDGPRIRSFKAAVGQPTATCPECGAAVPLIGVGWLAVHHEGSAAPAYPPRDSLRCPGSFVRMTPSAPRRR